MSLNFKNERLLVVAPHADDEILGCFGLIKKIKNLGGKVYVQILTMGVTRELILILLAKKHGIKNF